MLVLALLLVVLFVVVTLVRIRCDVGTQLIGQHWAVPWSACCQKLQECRNVVVQRWRDDYYPEYWQNPVSYARDVGRDIKFKKRLGRLAQRGQTWARDVSERALTLVGQAAEAL